MDLRAENRWNLQRVSVAFSTQQGIQTVLKDLTLTIAEGEWVAIVGRNGSGKSTLGRVLAGLLDISRGTLVDYLGNRPFAPFVFQNPEAQNLGDTIEEDVYFGLDCQGLSQEQMTKRAERALDLVHLSKQRHCKVSELSGGQKQRLAIADALALESDSLVFDEATSMLDPKSRQEVMQLVKQLHQQGSTIVWITQWLDELADASRVLALAGGEFVFDGTPREFFYGRPEDSLVGPTPCEQLGFRPPYVVNLARELHRKEQLTGFQPVSEEEFVEAFIK